jgi:hypothetical protein
VANLFGSIWSVNWPGGESQRRLLLETSSRVPRQRFRIFSAESYWAPFISLDWIILGVKRASCMPFKEMEIV